MQQPHPPFFIGGGGRRTLTLAAEQAQIVGLAPRILPGAIGDPASVTMAATAEKVAWVRAAAGSRFDELELNIYPSMTPVTITDRPLELAEEVAAQLAAASGQAVDPMTLLDSPHIFIGTVDSLCEKFLRLREELGISSIMVGEVDSLVPVIARLAGT